MVIEPALAGGRPNTQADSFLLAELDDREWHKASQVLTHAEDAGLAKRTVQRAARGKVERNGGGYGGQMMWRLRDDIDL